MRRLLTRTLIASLLGVMLLSLSACDLTDLNDNPNASSEARPDYIFNNATKDIAENYWGGFTLGRFGNIYAQYWTQNQYTAEDQYGFPTARSGVVNTMWGNYYLALNDLEEVVRLNEENPEETEFFGNPNNQIATAKILQAWTFHVMTDTWGPIPFSDALGGSENAAPSYNTQEEVYAGLIDLIDEALGLINTDADGFTSGDQIFGGDMEQWALFGNALKMRVAMRMVDVKESEAGALIEEAATAIDGLGGVEDFEGAAIPFDPSPPYRNPIYENYEVNGRDDWAVTANLIDLMDANSDPRLSAYAQAVSPGEYVGYTYGMTEGAAQARYSRGGFSRPGQDVRQADSPAILLLQDEVYFLLAEAAERGFSVGGDGETHFRNAVASSAEYWGVDPATASSFAEGLSYDGADYEQSIGEQKWIALYMQGVQGWAEWRRLDFEDVLTPPAGGSSDDDVNGIAVRITYPNDEAALNAGSLEGGIEALGGGGDTQGTRLWWDVDHNY